MNPKRESGKQESRKENQEGSQWFFPLLPFFLLS
jgi:hypothetical protein